MTRKWAKYLVVAAASALLVTTVATRVVAQTPPQEKPAPVPTGAGNPSMQDSASVELKWSSEDMDKTAAGNLEFHGPFNKENVTARCKGLGRHDYLKISYDLLILRVWAGSVFMTVGHAQPRDMRNDFFRCGLANGPTLVYATFSNVPVPTIIPPPSPFGDHCICRVIQSSAQSYPSQVPGDQLKPFAGAAAQNRLGYHYPWPVSRVLSPMDAVYHIEFLIPHQEDQAILQFSGMHIQTMQEENWGIAHLIVRTADASEVGRPGESEIARAFEIAANSKSVAADQPPAFQTLILGMDDTVDWIEKNVAERPIDGKLAGRLIENLWLDDHSMERRNSAGDALYIMGPQVEPRLRDARKTAVGEQRLRIDCVLACLDVHPITDESVRKVMLATRALEIIGTPHALQVRKNLTEY